MRFVADESVDRAIVERLRHEGHLVMYIGESDPGISDDEVLKIAAQQGSPLMTADKDFGELVYRQRRMDAGIILVRLAGMAQEAKADVVATTIRQHGEQMPNAFTVISPGLVRIRPR